MSVRSFLLALRLRKDVNDDAPRSEVRLLLLTSSHVPDGEESESERAEE